MEELLNEIIQNEADGQIESLIVSDLKNYSIYDPFDSQREVKILLSFYKDVLKFSKTSLFLSTQKQFLVLELSNKLIIEGTIKKPRSSISELKTIISSYSEYFNPTDLYGILLFFSSNYFQHIRLYNYIFSSKENIETTHVIAWIDDPLATMPLQQSVQRVKNKLPIEELIDSKVVQKSRSKGVVSRKGNDSKEPSQDLVLDSQQSEEPIIDPLVDTFQKFNLDIESEIQKRESVIEQEIEELKKKYR